MQTYALISSIKEYCPALFNINVLYTYSQEEYQRGFQRLSELFEYYGLNKNPNPFATFIYHKSGEFKKTLIDILSDQRYNHVCFATDDSLIFREAEYELIEERMEDVSCFSLRYGLNTVMQSHMENRYQPPLSTYTDEEETISWDFHDYHPFNNYGYPFGLDFHVYHREEFVNLCKRIEFDRPTELETNLLQFRDIIKPKIRSFKESCAVNVPLSNMTGATASMEVDVKFLNDEYLSGKRLSYIYNPEDIIGSHQNLEWEIK